MLFSEALRCSGRSRGEVENFGVKPLPSVWQWSVLSVIKPKILSTLYIFCAAPDLYIISLHVFILFQFFQSFPEFSSNYYRLLLIKPGRDRTVQCHSLRNVSADPDLQQDPALPFCCCLPKLSLQQLFANLSKEPDKFPTDKISTRGEVFHLYMPSSKICWEKIWK